MGGAFSTTDPASLQPTRSLPPSASPRQMPTPEHYNRKFNVCLALDVSGSVCAPDPALPRSCSNCPSECNQSPFDPGTCCRNFASLKAFAFDLLNAAADLTVDGSDVAVVAASSLMSPRRVVWPSHPDAVGPALDGLHYAGGHADHAGSLMECQKALDESSDPTGVDVVVLVAAGGVSPQPGRAARSSAASAADAIKRSGTHVRPVVVGDGTREQVDYLAGISSDGVVTEVAFDDLSVLVDSLVFDLLGRSDASAANPGNANPLIITADDNGNQRTMAGVGKVSACFSRLSFYLMHCLCIYICYYLRIPQRMNCPREGVFKLTPQAARPLQTNAARPLPARPSGSPIIAALSTA